MSIFYYIVILMVLKLTNEITIGRSEYGLYTNLKF